MENNNSKTKLESPVAKELAERVPQSENKEVQTPEIPKPELKIDVKVETPEDTVTLSKSQFEGLIGRLETLEERGKTRKPKRITENTAILRFHNDKAVRWAGNVVETLDKLTGRNIAHMDIKLYGEEKAIKVPYLEFLNAKNATLVRIKEQKAEEIVDVVESSRTRNPDPVHKKDFTSREMDMEVVTLKYTATVEVLEGSHKGDVYTLPGEALNM